MSPQAALSPARAPYSLPCLPQRHRARHCRRSGRLHRPRWLPWYLESYINGVHIFDKPQPGSFRCFRGRRSHLPDSAIGFLLCLRGRAAHEFAAIASIASGGAVLYALGLWLRRAPQRSTPSTISGTPARIFPRCAWES